MGFLTKFWRFLSVPNHSSERPRGVCGGDMENADECGGGTKPEWSRSDDAGAYALNDSPANGESNLRSGEECEPVLPRDGVHMDDGGKE